jgi:N-acetylneuraminate synthase
MPQPIPDPLFVFELANNHMGSVDHGLRVIEALRAAVADQPLRCAVKLQYRDLDSFIHPAYRQRMDLKYIKRFQETRLSEAQFRQLVAAIRAAGFVTVCTPFDEPSVRAIEEQQIDIVKIASCSVTDWPLLERVAASGKPVIASTAAASLEDLDKVVSFFEHRGQPLALMHCVAGYPTADAALELNQIDLLRARYPRNRIGYSTHENPDNVAAVQMAIAKGATLFEKHVGLATADWPLNNYSASPAQIAAWLASAGRAYAMAGVTGRRAAPLADELANLGSLRRGVYLRRAVRAGETLAAADVYFAFPPEPGQVTANDWSKYARFDVTAEIAADGALTPANSRRTDTRERIYQIVQAVRAVLLAGRVVVPGKAELEISHHYGLENFDRYGLVMITVVNREYCKKLIAMLPGQTHPEQYHRQKEETFMVLSGEMTVVLDGESRQLRAGDLVVVNRGVKHLFSTTTGVVFEELSSTHIKDDSFYTDPAVGANKDRKTYLTHWMDPA